MNLAEIALFIVLQKGEIQNVSSVNNDGSNHSIIAGDSLIQREQREQEDANIKRKLEEELQHRSRAVLARERTSRASGGDDRSVRMGNGYVYGYCTWYVAEQKSVPPDYGNARNWPVNSKTPEVGAIIVTYESWLGHVGIVTQVEGTQITIKEMNYAGFNKVSQRTVDYRTLPLKGFLI